MTWRMQSLWEAGEPAAWEGIPPCLPDPESHLSSGPSSYPHFCVHPPTPNGSEDEGLSSGTHLLVTK